MYRKLDPSGDYTFGQGSSDFYTDSTACAQAIYTTLKQLQGEWWTDLSVGLPLFQQILGSRVSNNDVTAMDMLVQEQILTVPGTQSIVSMQSSWDSSSRTYSLVQATVQTNFGDVVVEGVTWASF